MSRWTIVATSATVAPRLTVYGAPSSAGCPGIFEYTRTTQSELDSLFPRLENPDLVIYVYPHLATRTRAPIPGYTTVVPLYERVEYRLPGEALMTTPAPAQTTANSEEGTQ